MTPFARVAAGLVVVLVDLRLPDIDVVADPVGWVLVLLGLTALAGRDPWFRAAVGAAVVGGLCSLPALFAEPTGWLTAVDAIGSTALVFATCTGVIRLVGSDPAAATANRIRWIDLALTAIGAVLTLVVTTTGTTAAAPLLIPLVIATLAVFLWFIVFLVRVRHHPGLLGVEPAAA